MTVTTTDKVIKIDAITYHALSLLRDERGSFNDVIQDMIKEFAPFLYHMTIDQQNCDVEPKGLEGAKIQRYNELLGAKQAYRDFQRREVEAMEKECDTLGYAEIRDKVAAEFDGKSEDEFSD